MSAQVDRGRGTLDPSIPAKELQGDLNAAAALLFDWKKDTLTPELLLLAFVNDAGCNAQAILSNLLATRGRKWQPFAAAVQTAAQERNAPDVKFDWVSDNGQRVPLSDELLIVLDEALSMARAQDEVYVGTQHALLGMLHPKVGLARFLESYGITERALQESLRDQALTRSATTTDYVALAKQGDIQPVYFREELLRDLIGLLTLAQDRHVILVGPEGVGKRTLVYSLALVIADGKGPAGLDAVVRINEEALLDNSKAALQAGIRRAKGGILFVPHIARFFGGFRADFPEQTAKELMKAFFSQDVVVVGTATEGEYSERIKTNSAVNSRSHALRVEAASVDETTAMLAAIKPRLESDYQLSIAEDCLQETARLAGRYLTNAPLPASAVQLLHRACAMVKMSEQAGMGSTANVKQDGTLDTEDVLITVSQLTSIPVAKLGADERARYAHMVEFLRQRIIGQDEALIAVSRAVKTARVGLKDPKRPIGSFFFLGPTGVGKSELAKALTEFLFGSEDNMIVLDMTEYQDENAVNRMIGAPPGYVGYEEGGQLTEKMAASPYAVVLFDEVEKAHPRVLDVLLQIMEEGRLTDGKGRTVSFTDSVIILTSNIGGEYLVDPNLSYASAREKAEGALKRSFRPEFLNRLSDIIFFNRLDDSALRGILDLLLAKEIKLAGQQGIRLEVSDPARSWLLQQNQHPEWGARPLRRILEKHIREPLADWLIKENPPADSAVRVDMGRDILRFSRMG